MFLENKNKKIAQGMGSTRSVRLATRYEKARQDVGLFYCLKLRITCIMLIVGFLKKFRPFSRENHYPPVGLKKCPTINLLSNSKNHTHSRVCNDRAIQQINKTTAVYIGALLTDALLKINLV